MEGGSFNPALASSVQGTSERLDFLGTWNNANTKIVVVSHKAEITGLNPGTTYSYRVGASEDTEEGWSKPQSFTTEAVDSSSNPFTFAHITDTQDAGLTYDWFERTVNAAVTQVPDLKFFAHSGDLVERAASESQYRQLLLKGKGVIDSVPMMTTLGNHDYDGSSPPAISGYGGLGINYASHFNLPVNGAAVARVKGGTYSFDYGSVHFVAIDTEYPTGDSTARNLADWLKRDLAGTDKPWKIVYLHQGPYVGRSYASSRVTRVREHLVPVFDEYEVDLVLQGHDHHSARSYFMKGVLNPITPPGSALPNLSLYPQILKLGDGVTPVSASVTPVKDQAGTIYTIGNSTGYKHYDDIGSSGANPYMNNLPWFDKFEQPGMGMFTTYTVDGETIAAAAYNVNSSGAVVGIEDSFKLLRTITPPVEAENVDYVFTGTAINICWDDFAGDGADVLIYDLYNLSKAPIVVPRSAETTSIPMATDMASRYIIKTRLGRNLSAGQNVAEAAAVQGYLLAG